MTNINNKKFIEQKFDGPIVPRAWDRLFCVKSGHNFILYSVNQKSKKTTEITKE